MSIQLKCLSHTPLRGLNDPGADVVAEVDAILAQSRAEVEAFDPELIVVFAPDHYNGLFYDLMPPFVIATAAESGVARDAKKAQFGRKPRRGHAVFPKTH